MSNANNEDLSVAVIIPYYNGSRYIERSARSVLEQTVRPNEFIVVNDGSSPDETAKLEVISKQLGFDVIHKENGGQGSARNYGVRNTKSNYICFLDQDDFFLKNHIEILLAGLPRNDPHFGWVYADLNEADEDGNVLKRNYVAHLSSHPKMSILDMLSNDMFVLPSASLISRSAFDSVGGFDTQFTGYEDDDLFIRIFQKGYSNYFINKPVTVWCIHNNSTSYSIKMSRSRFRYVKKILQTFKDDQDRSLFYVRDIIVPRFTKQIFSDAIRSTNPSKSKQDQKIAKNRDELVDIMISYVNLILKNKYVQKKIKIEIFAKSLVIRTKSGILYAFSRNIYKLFKNQ